MAEPGDGPCTLTETAPETGWTLVTTYSYDNEGRLVESKNDACDISTNEMGCLWVTYTYDEQGNVLVERTIGTNNDGTAEVCSYHTYDAQGLLVRVEDHMDCAQNASSYDDTARTYTYDAAGRIVTETYMTYDPVSVGSFRTRSTIHNEYDANGWLSRQTSSGVGSNGRDTVVTVILYTYDSAGHVLSTEFQDPEHDDYQIVCTHDEDGNYLTGTTIYLEGSQAGVEQRCLATTYDDCGNKLTEQCSLGCDDSLYWQDLWSYACFEQ